MWLKQVELHRFKRFRDFTLDLTQPVGWPDVILLVGDNGAGKSTILQAIAATLGTATGQINSPEALDWPGFVMASLSATHRGFAEVRLEVAFTSEELEATQRFYAASDYATLDNAPPAQDTAVTLVWSTNPGARYPVRTEPESAGRFFQFQGRRYAYNLLYNRRAPEGMFEQIGGVFWYTEHRTSYSLAPFTPEGGDRNGRSQVKQIDDEMSMRSLLTRWFAFDASGRGHKLKRFNAYYGRLFPGRSLSRIDDMYGATSSILFDDGANEYEINELSGGERALMPLLLDFVEWGINNSVILIDELELHLHPPLQQALLTLLPELGSNNQFIITTHSDAVANLVPSDAIKRVSLHEYRY